MDKRRAPIDTQLIKIELAPFDCWQAGGGRQTKKSPLGLTALKRDKKLTMPIRHLADNLVY